MIFNSSIFSEDIKSKRLKEKKGVRAVSKESGISAATISRVENMNLPDINSFGKLCAWVGNSPEKYFKI